VNWWCRWMRPIKIQIKTKFGFSRNGLNLTQGSLYWTRWQSKEEKSICHFENAQFSELWKCGNWIAGPGSSQLGMRSTIAITFARLFLLPPIGMSSSADSRPIGIPSTSWQNVPICAPSAAIHAYVHTCRYIHTSTQDSCRNLSSMAKSWSALSASHCLLSGEWHQATHQQVLCCYLNL
jgi:hypothetical protein